MAKASDTRLKSSRSKPQPPRIAIAIMAAGKGTRLKSKHPKVLHEVGGKPILAHVIATAEKVVPARDIFVIIGHEAERVREAVAGTGVNFVVQAEQRGTGHALMVLSADLDSPYSYSCGYGRVIRSSLAAGRGRPALHRGAEVRAIVEEKSATPQEKKIREINSGFYAFSGHDLYAYIDRLSTANAHGEYYLTDMAGVFHRAGKK